MAYLYTQNLTIGYTAKGATNVVLKDLNLSLNRGSIVSLLGANGAGKSTLLRTITAVQRPLEGNVLLADADINSLTLQERSRLIGIVSTDRIMAGGLTVRELVSLGRQPHTGFLGRLNKEDKAIVEEALNDAGIAHKANCFVAQLSDGERQKAMIAKTLAQRTPIIILDEPTAFLDVASRMETLSLLHNLAHKHNKAVLLSSHDISQSLLLSDHLWIITNNGEMITGNTEDLILNGTLDKMFNSSALHFNKESGDFEMNLPTEHEISLKCSNSVLRRCITNALIRNNFRVVGSAVQTIEASANGNEYKISLNGKLVHNISEMISLLTL